MHSSMIGKVEKAMRYAHEPDRVKLQSFSASFAGDNGTHTVVSRRRSVAVRLPSLRVGRRLHPHAGDPEDARPDAHRRRPRDAAVRPRRRPGRGRRPGLIPPLRRPSVRASIGRSTEDDAVGAVRRKDGRVNGEAGERPAQSRYCIRGPIGAMGRVGARSPSRVAMSPPSRERDGHHMAHSRHPLVAFLVLLLAVTACAPAGESPSADAASTAPTDPPATAQPDRRGGLSRSTLTDDADRERHDRGRARAHRQPRPVEHGDRLRPRRLRPAGRRDGLRRLSARGRRRDRRRHPDRRSTWSSSSTPSRTSSSPPATS